jgi:hypothetical protein
MLEVGMRWKRDRVGVEDGSELVLVASVVLIVFFLAISWFQGPKGFQKREGEEVVEPNSRSHPMARDNLLEDREDQKSKKENRVPKNIVVGS